MIQKHPSARSTISSIKKKCDILQKKFFHIRPSHQIRYGLKTIESKLTWRIPIIRELLISGTVFLIKKINNY